MQTLVPEAGDRSHNVCRDGVAPGPPPFLHAWVDVAIAQTGYAICGSMLNYDLFER
jgi:hypothetical protein